MPYPYAGHVYDQIARSTTDLPFWRSVLAERRGTVLELGVGTGRLALELAPLAEEYHGLDVEPSMLAVAAAKARERGVNIELHAGDFTSLSIGRAFDLVLLPANTLSHVIEPSDTLSCFHGVRKHCVAGGLFVIDTYNPRPWARGPEPYQFGRYVDPADGCEVVVWSTATYDAAMQVATHQLEYKKGSTTIDRRNLRQRAYYPEELRRWLTRGGFRDVTLLGDYDRSPLDESSSRLIALAG